VLPVVPVISEQPSYSVSWVSVTVTHNILSFNCYNSEIWGFHGGGDCNNVL
jgi:hypothetical protein